MKIEQSNRFSESKGCLRNICKATLLPSHKSPGAAVYYRDRYCPGFIIVHLWWCEHCGGYHWITKPDHLRKTQLPQ